MRSNKSNNSIPKCLFKLSKDGGCVGTVNDQCKNCDKRAIATNRLLALKAIEPVNNLTAVFDALKADPIMKGVFADVVENKETVEAAVLKHLQHSGLSPNGQYIFINGAEFGANWQQSQSIEGIVVFVLEYFDKRFVVTHKDFTNSDTGIIADIKVLQDDIIKEYNNGK